MLLLATALVLTGCRIAEHGRRAAIDAFASFVLDSVLRAQMAAPLTQPAPSGGQALLPVRSVPLVARVVEAPACPLADRRERLSSRTLPKPVSRIASVNLAPRAELCRSIRVRAFDVARANVEARMAMAEMRGTHIRRIVVVVPDVEVPQAPASL